MKRKAKELRRQVDAALARVERGEAATLAGRGKPAARSVAVDQGAAEQDTAQMPAFGMWGDRQDIADVDAHVRELREGRAVVGALLAKGTIT